MKGLIHIYEGDGKGKTTAAIGLAVRCAGSGGKVLLVQFMKSNCSNELKILKKIDLIDMLHSEENFGFYWDMTEETKKKAQESYERLFHTAIDRIVVEDYRLLILDEVIDAYHLHMIPQDLLLDFLRNKPEQLEVVMTGRNPGTELVELADYVSNMRKVKHPFDQGMKARNGIEN